MHRERVAKRIEHSYGRHEEVMDFTCPACLERLDRIRNGF